MRLRWPWKFGKEGPERPDASLDQVWHYGLYAFAYQFYLQDESVDGDLSNGWTEEAVARLLALAPGTIGVGTVREAMLPVTVEVRQTGTDEDLGQWDQVNECSLQVSSGRIVVAGTADYFPEAARIQVPPGCYRARLFYGGLRSVAGDEATGEDHYRVVIWPAEPAGPVVLKQRA